MADNTIFVDNSDKVRAAIDAAIIRALERCGMQAEGYAKEIHIPTICFHVEKSNTAAFRLYERLGYGIYEDQGSRYLMIKNI